jgi:hypothetical protein
VAEDAPAGMPDEELAARLEEELRKLTVSDVLVQTALTLSSLGFSKLSGDTPDLAQARTAIEALKAIVPVIGDTVPEQTMRDLNSVVANLQLAYATAASGSKGDEGPAES